MREDFTLIIPTFNRPSDLGMLLSYLEKQQATFQILVLDSSHPEERELNQQTVANSGLNLDYNEFDVSTHPFDKFRAGVDMVETPYCSLCADDDIPLVSGIDASVDKLKADSDFSVAHGYYFQFAHQTKALNLASITYYTPDNDEEEPVARVHTLMRHYQALTYGVYKTGVLQNIFQSVEPVSSLLGRELLSSALAVVQGKIARLNCFYMGRNLGPSSGHVHWHPLEWSIKSPEGLFAEYGRYREILAKEVVLQTTNKHSINEVKRLLDLIHLHYYVRHAPEESLDFAIDAVARGIDADEIFGAPEVTHPLMEAAVRYTAREQNTKREENKGNTENSKLPSLASAVNPSRAKLHNGSVDRLRQFMNVGHNIPFLIGRMADALSSRPGVFSTQQTHANNGSVDESAVRYIRTNARSYTLQPGFHSPPSSFGVSFSSANHTELLAALDTYA